MVALEDSQDVPSARSCAALPYGFHKLILSRKRTVNLYIRSRAWLIESKGFPAKNSPTIHLALVLHVYRTNPEKNGINIKSSLCCNPDPKSLQIGSRVSRMGVPYGRRGGCPHPAVPGVGAACRGPARTRGRVVHVSVPERRGGAGMRVASLAVALLKINRSGDNPGCVPGCA